MKWEPLLTAVLVLVVACDRLVPSAPVAPPALVEPSAPIVLPPPMPVVLPPREVPEPPTDPLVGGHSGVLAPSVVVARIRSHVSEISHCYEERLGHTPTLHGRVVVHFTILESGDVANAHATENDTGDPTLGACITERVGALHFDPGPTGGPVEFSYPFVFAPAE